MHVRVYRYKCRNKTCNNEMQDKVLEGYEPIAAFHCNKCGLGRGKKLDFIQQHGAGMFPGPQSIEEYETADFNALKQMEGPGHGLVVVK
ncbi:hypothetical protein LCGC14_2383070 [marine sediment metagenome]|uniref:Uncharacterized protein n=1 Tax=marine sediment metagenome TaxID=412755 RepID=A0A0F9CMH5_9ZZZZ